jgi:outer membrane lipoprotein-sorting protein
MVIRLTILLLATATCSLAQPTTDASLDIPPAGIDAQLWSRMLEINDRSMAIEDLTAAFRQEKHTSLLKRPLVSTGTVRVRGELMRWEIASPEPMVMLITDHDVRLYYPQQKVMEIFEIDQQLASLASSPLPRLGVLRKHFSFAAIDPGEMDPSGEADDLLALELTPLEESLKQHITRVRVLLAAAAGYILRVEMVDADEDRTVIIFSDVKTNTGLEPEALDLKLPRDVTITRPLERLHPDRRG